MMPFKVLERLAPPHVPNHLAGRIRVRQVDSLARLGGAIGCVGVLAAATIVASFWDVAPKVYLVGFLSAFVVLYALGFRRSLLWQSRPMPLSMDRRTFVVRNLHVGLIGLLWSTMPPMLTPYASAEQHLMVVYVSSGLIASGIVIAPTVLAALLVSVPVMAGSFLSMVLPDGPSATVLGVLVLIYSSLIFVSIIYSYRSFIERTVNQMEMEEQSEVIGLLLREFEQNSSDWLWRTDANGRLTHVSGRMAQVTGLSETDLHGRDILTWLTAQHDRRVPQGGEQVLAHLATTLRDLGAFRDLLVPVKVNGDRRWWSITGKPVFDRAGAFAGYRGVGSDVTETKRSQARIAHMADHDSLTDLPNRALFQKVLTSALSVAEGRAALLWLDLDGFKTVNDTHGHGAGDALLVAVAHRLSACLNPADSVARLGGDEFAVLKTGGDAAAAEELARRIVEVLSAPFHVHDVQLGIGVSIGIALAPGDAQTADDLLRSADLALYRAKHEGRRTWRFYEVEMDRRAKERRTLQSDLRQALDRNEFSLVFQPLVDLQTRQIATAEALLRWSRPGCGLVSPDQFIPIAEETGLIVAIGAYVLREACLQAVSWPGMTRVAVNLSPVQFRDAALLDSIDAALAETGLSPERLELEITESIFLEASEATLTRLHHLRRRGIRVALDDFGTGYSSLSYLRSFPFDKVKIDKSFIRDIADDKSSLSIVRAIMAMAGSLGMAVVAEGVETREQLAVLQAQGCDQVQGYLFSRPVPDREIAAYIEAAVQARAA